MSKLIFTAKTDADAGRLDRWLALSEYRAERTGNTFFFEEENLATLESELAPNFMEVWIDGHFETESED